LNAQKTEQAGSAPAPGPAVKAARALRILIVDDHAIMRQGLRQLLSDAFPESVFGEANNGAEALELIWKHPWDVVLLDITMPGQSGLDVLKQLSNAQPNLAVLVLSMHPEDQYAVRVLKAGAVGYITKNTASEEVVSAVRKVIAGGKYVSASLAETLATGLTTHNEHEALSDREYQVLRLLAAGKSVKEIGYDLSLSVKTISTYRSRVMEKMNLKSNAEIIRYAMDHKLVD
jgi:two-component system invasion response regulator UvrY